MKLYQCLTMNIFKSKTIQYQLTEFISCNNSKYCFMTFCLQWCVHKSVCVATEIVFFYTLSDSKNRKQLGKHSCMPPEQSQPYIILHLHCTSSAVAVASSKPSDYTGSIKLTASANFTKHRIVSIGPRRCQSGWYTLNYISPHLKFTFQYMASSTPSDYFNIIIFYPSNLKKE